MTEILLRTDLSHDSDLVKIDKSIYYDPKTLIFFRLSFLPHGVVFLKEDVIQPPIASLTRYDPYFLAINNFSKNKGKMSSIPDYLKHLDFQKISEKHDTNGSSYYSLDQTKVFNFLEGKVTKLQKCINQYDLEKSFFKADQIDHKYITPEIISVLKSQIYDHAMVDIFARQRYAYTPLRKVMPDEDEGKNHQSKPKSKPKAQPKKEEPKLQHNQKTLNSFFTQKSKQDK